MMDLRKRIFLIVSIVVGFLLAILLIYIVANREPAPASEIESGLKQNNEAGLESSGATPGQVIVKKSAVVESDISKTTVANPEGLYVTQLARLFVERYGTYSNEDGNKHIDDLLPLATPIMADWLKTKMIPFSSTFQAKTTSLVTSLVTSITDAAAVVSIGVHEITETKDGKTDLQKTGRVEFVKTNGEWKVDGLYYD